MHVAIAVNNVCRREKYCGIYLTTLVLFQATLKSLSAIETDLPYDSFT